jgi:hypothetical protein
MWRLVSLALWLFAVAPLAAQWSVGADVGMLRFWGTSIDTTTLDDPVSERPSPATRYAVGVERRFGTVGVGIGLLYSSGGVRAENGSIAVDAKDGAKLYEVAAEVSLLIAKPGPGGALRLHVGPMFDRWTLTGGADTRRAGAHAAVSLEWPIAGRLTGVFRGGAAVSACVFSAEDFPPEYAQRTTWRRAFSAGISVRL